MKKALLLLVLIMLLPISSSYAVKAAVKSAVVNPDAIYLTYFITMNWKWQEDLYTWKDYQTHGYFYYDPFTGEIWIDCFTDYWGAIEYYGYCNWFYAGKNIPFVVYDQTSGDYYPILGTFKIPTNGMKVSGKFTGTYEYDFYNVSFKGVLDY